MPNAVMRDFSSRCICFIYVLMGKNAPIRPGWTESLDQMIAHGVLCRAMCTQCNGWRDLDLEVLASRIGSDATLWGKRTRCRLTEGCNGWNRFYYDGRGRFTPMWD